MKINLNPKYKQLFKNHGCRYVVITGGRGSGKSYALATFLRWYMTVEKDSTFLFTRWTKSSAFDSIIKEFTEKVDLLQLEGRTKKIRNDFTDTFTNTNLLFKGIQTSSGNQTAALKSLTNLSVWVLDEAEELVDEDIFETISASVRMKEKRNLIIISMNPTDINHWAYKRFFEEVKVAPDFNGIHEDTLYINTTYLDNLKWLSESVLKDIERMKHYRYERWRHMYLGEWLTDTLGALWNSEMLYTAKKLYNKDAEHMKIVVSVDPSAEAHGNQDECGIIVAAKISDDEYVVLEDCSGVYSPAEWGKETIKAYKKWEANAIIVEKNQGGQMCVDTILNNVPSSERRTIKVEKVHASKGKIARAEPIATLYENDCVAHAPNLQELELELTTYTGNKKQASPGRLDAMVWGLTYLSNKKKKARIFV